MHEFSVQLLDSYFDRGGIEPWSDRPCFPIDGVGSSFATDPWAAVGGATPGETRSVQTGVSYRPPPAWTFSRQHVHASEEPRRGAEAQH